MEIAAAENVPPGLVEWALSFASTREARAACERADWLLWLAHREPLDEEQQKSLVAAASILAGPLVSPLERLSPLPTKAEVAAFWPRRSESITSPFRALWGALLLMGVPGIVVATLGLTLPVPIAARVAMTVIPMVGYPLAQLAFLRLRRRTLRTRAETMSYEDTWSVLYPLVQNRDENADPQRRKARLAIARRLVAQLFGDNSR